MKNRSYYNYLLASGHVCSDINQGVLSAILPFLIAAHHYDYATAATLVLVANIAGSVVQPLLGHLADRKNIPWSMSLGLLMANRYRFFCGRFAIKKILLQQKTIYDNIRR